MSTIRANTLANAGGSKSVPVDTVVDGSAKAWVNFNGTGTVAIRSAFNVSSITDFGVGLYGVNLTTPMPDANFAPIVSGGSAEASIFGGLSSTLPTASVIRVASMLPNASPQDNATMTVAVFR